MDGDDPAHARRGHCHVGGLHRHSESESEIDEIGQIGRAIARKDQPAAVLAILVGHVEQMRVMKRVDRIGEGPHENQRQRDQQFVPPPKRGTVGDLRDDRGEDDQRQRDAQRKQNMAVGIIVSGDPAHVVDLLAEQWDAREKKADRGEIETGEQPALGSDQGNPRSPADCEQRKEQKEARGRDPVADGLRACHGWKITESGRSSSDQGE